MDELEEEVRKMEKLSKTDTVLTDEEQEIRDKRIAVIQRIIGRKLW